MSTIVEQNHCLDGLPEGLNQTNINEVIKNKTVEA